MSSSHKKSATNNIKLRSIAVDKLHPNDWNPNKMTDEEFRELVEEVRRLGRIPKPVIVRPSDDGYEIIDGEHNWRAAKEVGLAEVPCEVVEIDDFHAMQETYKRNQHGRHDPLLEAEMFERMMRERGLTQRGLAEEVDISEGTVRNRLKYVEALRVRSACAPGDQARQEISQLSLRQIDSYLDLPQGLRDRWLDAGAEMSVFKCYFHEKDEELGKRTVTAMELIQRVHGAGLGDLIDMRTFDFPRSAAYVFQLVKSKRQCFLVPNIEPFVRAVAELKLPVWTLDLLQFVQDNKGNVRPALTLERWTEILSDAQQHASGKQDLYEMILTGMRMTLEERGVNLDKVYGPKYARMVQDLQKSPEFIREADHLSVEEKWTLHQQGEGLPDEVALRCKQMVCELLRGHRRGEVSLGKLPSDGSHISFLFASCVQKIANEQKIAKEQELFTDRPRLEAAVMEYLAQDERLAQAQVDGQEARQVLEKEIGELKPQMLALVAAHVLRSRSPAIAHWLAAAGAECPAEATASD